jgi:hypothetical protein
MLKLLPRTSEGFSWSLTADMCRGAAGQAIYLEPSFLMLSLLLAYEKQCANQNINQRHARAISNVSVGLPAL